MKNTAIEIVKKINNAGYEAYWAGGCVRDILMKKTPKDYDIVTSAKPEEIEKLLKKTISVGKQFGVIIAQVGKFNFEIATFRSEGKYLDSRHPDKVFWTNAKKDAKRRDFTINGMFYDPINKKIIDYVDGQKDLKEKVIRFIGDADKRIKEDNLRILRAIRFKNTLGFKYDKPTWQAICNNSFRIKSVSNERVASELNKMFADKNRVNALSDLSGSGLLKYILPEVEKLKGLPQPKEFHKEGDVFVHTFETIKILSPDAPLTLVWTMLLHDVGKASTITMPKDKKDRIRFNNHDHYSAGIVSKICRRLKFPNVERELIVWLVKMHMSISQIPKMRITKRRRLLLDPRFPWLMQVFNADSLGRKPQKIDMYRKIEELYEEEQAKPEFKLFLTGADLIYEFKLDEGPEIGIILKKVEDAQLEGKINNKKEALKFAGQLLRKRNKI